MRMVHYYWALALVLAPALLGTLATGIWHDGTQRHLALGLFTAILCVAAQTLLILFMIVTGRVLKAAMQARSLGPEFLAELNDFFAKKKAYPFAILGATLAVATAVLGHGQFIGVPTWVHFLVGLIAVIFNLYSIPVAARTLRANQALLDRASRELDRLDQEGVPPLEDSDEIAWAYGHRTRWIIYALSAWLPYAYWVFVVWRGDASRVPRLFLVGTALASGTALFIAWKGARSDATRPQGDP